ncbi:hypothetical protein PCK1_001145 [Pneumocystis canis]|nr:hypothetical protein PCK1_001145 [Pneumocystis canis]
MNHQKSSRIILDDNIPETSRENPQFLDESLNSKVHLLPCHIHWDGPANVSKYFHVRSIPDSSAYYATFRGRGLEGHSVVLPSNYEGVVYNLENNTSDIFKQLPNNNTEEDLTDLDETTDSIKKWNRIGTFSTFNIWDHQSFHNQTHKNPIRALEEWIDLASILHSNTENLEDA